MVRAEPDRTVPWRYRGRVAAGLSGLRAAHRLHVDEHRPPSSRRIASSTTTWPTASSTKAEPTKDFYDEYFAVLDLTAEFYLETVGGVPGARAAARAS